jgi:hypothetical protein
LCPYHRWNLENQWDRLRLLRPLHLCRQLRLFGRFDLCDRLRLLRPWHLLHPWIRLRLFGQFDRFGLCHLCRLCHLCHL